MSSSDGDSGPNNVANSEQPSAPQLGPDEAFCQSCGETIKQEAEICPECGVRQTAAPSFSSDSGGFEISDRRRYELEKLAGKDITTVMIVGFLLSPAGYVMVGKNGLAILNLITFNYFLLGIIVVPFHARKMIKDARAELSRAGVGGY